MKILAFDIGGTAVKYGVWTDGKLSDTAEYPTQAELGGRHIMETLKTLIRQENRFDGIGISTAGQVNTADGSIIYANPNIPDYTGMKIREELEDLFHVPAAVENDVNAAALGEAVFGAGRGIPAFLCLTYGTGVGGAIIEDGRVYHGSSYSAAEFGAIVTHSPEKISGGLWDGCYERYASVTALIRTARQYDSTLNDGRAVFAALNDPQVMRILDHWIDEIMTGLSSIIHIFNPSCVILGGGIMAQPLIFEKIAARREHFIMPSFSHVEIRPAQLGNRAGLLGAAYLAQQRIRQHQAQPLRQHQA